MENNNKQDILDLIEQLNYPKNLLLWTDWINFFTKEEILNFSNEDIDLIEKIFSSPLGYEEPKKLAEIAMNKFKEIKKINPNFNTKLDIFVYNVLSIEQIMKISKSCAISMNIICRNFKLHYLANNERISEKIIKKWIKEEYYKDTIKRSVKKLVKTK